jgi:hypothetical protein
MQTERGCILQDTSEFYTSWLLKLLMGGDEGWCGVDVCRTTLEATADRSARLAATAASLLRQLEVRHAHVTCCVLVQVSSHVGRCILGLPGCEQGRKEGGDNPHAVSMSLCHIAWELRSAVAHFV